MEANRRAAITQRTPRRNTTDFTKRANYRQKNARSISTMGGGAAVRPNIYIDKSPKFKSVKKTKSWSLPAKFDYPFFKIVVILLAFGLVMMFSASYDYALREHNNIYHYAGRQLMFIAVGIVAMLFISFIDYHILQNKVIIKIAVAISFGLMLLVKIIGVTQWGSERWLTIAGITFQPSEILKVVVIIFLAYLGEKNYEKRGDFKKGFMPFVLFLAIACTATIIQPHLSGTIIIFSVGLALMFISECKIKYMALMIIGAIALGIVGILALKSIGYDYFDSRILSWQNPEADPQDGTYQTYQSLITIGSGGLFGLGLGNSRQKYSYLPASHNDFVFSVICEELGFIGAVVIILLFLLLICRGFYIAARARDKFGMLVAAGITMQIGIQALLNIGVVTNSVPNTGISLPFFSYGGSALLMQLIEMGIVLNISRKAAIE